MLPENSKLIVRFITGSRLYGTFTEDSDYDDRGVFIAPPNYYIGLSDIQQVESQSEDKVFYELSKFMNLALKNNPNILEFLFVPEDKWIKSSPEWERIIENRDYFLSTKARWTFGGYAFAQLKRIKTHRRYLLDPPKRQPKRSDYGLPEHKSLISKSQIGTFEKLIKIYLEDIHQIHPLAKEISAVLQSHPWDSIIKNYAVIESGVAEDILGMSKEITEAIKRERQYASDLREWKRYLHWKETRNPKRAFIEKKYGYDCKHGQHLVRLIYEGEELLTTGKITFPRPEAPLLKEILSGEWTYDELMDFVGDIDTRFDKLYKESPLPKNPDFKVVEDICVETISGYIKETNR